MYRTSWVTMETRWTLAPHPGGPRASPPVGLEVVLAVPDHVGRPGQDGVAEDLPSPLQLL